MTVAAELLARLEQHHITAHVASDGRIELSGPRVPEKAQRLAEKHTGPLRGILEHRAYLETGEPAEWCNRCGATVTQYDPDGKAWCDPCLAAHATRIITEAFPESEIVEEATPTPQTKH